MVYVIKGIAGLMALILAIAIATEVFKMLISCAIFAGIYAYIEYTQRKNKGEKL